MFIKIGEKGVRVNAMNINSIVPFEETIEEKSGTETTHYGVRLNGTIDPSNTIFFFDDEEGRDEFLNSLDNDRITIPLEGKAASTASAQKKAPSKTKRRG